MDKEQMPPKSVMEIGPPPDFDTSRSKRCFLDVSFGALPEHKLDLYLPEEGEGPFPLIIYVMRGWSFGTSGCALTRLMRHERMGCLCVVTGCSVRSSRIFLRRKGSGAFQGMRRV